MQSDTSLRRAWLEVGGFVAAADGLSDDEMSQLSMAAAGPDLTQEEAAELITHGAAASSLSDEVVAAVSASDIGFRLDCMLDVFHAVAVDGMSGPEWSRFCDVGNQVLGADKVSPLIKICTLLEAVSTARASLVLD